MRTRGSWFFGALLCGCLAIGASANSSQGNGRQAINDSNQLPTNYVPTGKVMFTDYCAACHGLDAQGDGPTASLLKVPPANLATLAKRHGGKFPYEYVSGVLRFGTGPTLFHGSSEMPIWGPLFEYMDHYNEMVVQQRIKNLADYLASIQER